MLSHLEGYARNDIQFFVQPLTLAMYSEYGDSFFDDLLGLSFERFRL
jgi:hypothetical protein